jgi:hypothetical protein
MEASQAQATNRPRLDPYLRLMSRFYEPLILLHVLDPNGARRSSHCPSIESMGPQPDLRELRRNFLVQLAYVCDNNKGGETVTAIALEDQSPRVIFWIASNENPSDRRLSFLQEILNILRSLSSIQTRDSVLQIEKQLAKKCIDFNTKRIRDDRRLMRKQLQLCLENLKTSEAAESE